MARHLPNQPLSLAAAAAVNGALSVALGALLWGLPGAQAGLVVGIVLAAMPTAVRAALRWLARPDNILRLVGAAAATAIVRVASRIVDRVGALLAPVGEILRLPVLLVRFVGIVASAAAGAALSAVGRVLATPLGLANLAALAVIAVNLAGFEFATPVTILGLGLLILVLLVDRNEASGAAEVSGEGERK